MFGIRNTALSRQEHVAQFAHENGMYVIVQSARATEILPRPEGFVAKKW